MFKVGEKARALQSSDAGAIRAGKVYRVSGYVDGQVHIERNERGVPDAWGAEYFERADRPKFSIGDTVRSSWSGKVVGTYSTSLTPEGYAVESSTETGSVQIYPAAALERVET